MEGNPKDFFTIILGKEMRRMRKCRPIVLLLLISLLFTACAGNPAAPTSTDPTPSSPTQPTNPVTPELTSLTADEIAELQNIYQLVITEDLVPIPNFYNTALGLEYSDPRDISLSYFFRQGDYSDFDNTVMTDEEYAFLKANDKNAEFLDWYRISSQDVDRVLQMCFGLSLADMNNDLSGLLYWADTDCYYAGTTSPAPYAMNLEITGGVHLENGNLEVHYRNSESDKIHWKYYIMILKPVDGGYHILSNLEVEE